MSTDPSLADLGLISALPMRKTFPRVDLGTGCLSGSHPHPLFLYSQDPGPGLKPGNTQVQVATGPLGASDLPSLHHP